MKYKNPRRIFFALTAVLIAFSCFDDPGQYDGEELGEIVIASDAVRILLLGDWGTGESGQQEVADSIITVHSADPVDFALLLGDNFYPDGVSSVDDPQWETTFRAIYPASSLPFKFYAVLGNHDYYSNPQAQYDYAEPDDNRWICPSIGYVIPVRLSDNTLVEIFMIDSEIINQGGRKAFRLAEWAAERIRSSEADYRILADHRPLFSSGYHGDSTAMNNYFFDEFSEGFLDMNVAGHDHDLELQARELDSDSSVELFVVSGAGAKTREITAGTYSLFACGELGFTVLDLSAAGPSLKFYGTSAAELYTY